VGCGLAWVLSAGAHARCTVLDGGGTLGIESCYGILNLCCSYKSWVVLFQDSCRWVQVGLRLALPAHEASASCVLVYPYIM
jgi:hypothetical protein